MASCNYNLSSISNVIQIMLHDNYIAIKSAESDIDASN